jgi:hypothetical protein
MSLLKSLISATGCAQKASEERQAYLVRLVTAVTELTEDDWAKLPDDAQDWTNDAIIAIKARNEIEDPEASAPVEAVEPARQAAPAPVATKSSEPKAAKAEKPEKAPKAAAPAGKSEAFTAKPGVTQFRRAVVLALVKGDKVNHKEMIKELGCNISDSYAWSIADEARKLVDVLRQEKLFK